MCQTSNTEEAPNFEAVSASLGFGKFQARSVTLGAFSSVFSGALVMLPVFAAQRERYRCYVPSCDNVNTVYYERFLHFTTPWNQELLKWEACYHYAESNIASCSPEGFDHNETLPCSKYVYQEEVFRSTAVTEFDLTCEKEALIPLPGTVYQIGMLLSAIVFGYISDAYGRKTALLLAAGLGFCTTLLAALMPTYWSFLAVVFFVGAAGVAAYQAAFVAALEYVSNRWKTFSGTLVSMSYAFGELYTILMAYWLREYKYIFVAVACLGIPYIAYFWIMPESTRWLLSLGRVEKAKLIVDEAAKMNGVPSPSQLLGSIEEDKSATEGGLSPREILTILKKYPAIRARYFILSFCWCVCALVYFGFSSTAGSLSGNIFFNLAITIAVEIPAGLVAYFMLQSLGRKGTHVIVFLSCGIACIASVYLPTAWRMPRLALNFIGKFAITIAFTGIAIYTGEIFPTKYRTLGVGGCILFSRIGGGSAPLVAHSAYLYPPLPLLIFGLLSITAGCLVVLLPETLGCHLPQTLEESESLGKGDSAWKFRKNSRERKM